MVIDDQQDIAALIAHYLGANGYETTIVQNGQQARQHLQAQLPDLILLDVLLPDANGFDLCREFKSLKATMMVPVILITSLDSKQDRILGIEAGCDEFLSKPVHRDELRARVQSLLKLQRTRRELEFERLTNEESKRAAMRATFERYLAPKVVEQVLDAGLNAFVQHGGERQDVVALFADMRGFTRMSESLPALDVVSILNQYFSKLTEIAHRHEGTVLSMAGDCLLIGFGAPIPLADIEMSAFQTAHEIVCEISPLAEQWKARYGVTVGVGIGMNRGEAIVGNVGSTSYMNYTMIGDVVNVAARLTDLAGMGEVLCAGRMRATALKLGGRLTNESQQDVALKGKTQPVRAYKYKSG